MAGGMGVIAPLSDTSARNDASADLPYGIASEVRATSTSDAITRSALNALAHLWGSPAALIAFGYPAALALGYTLKPTLGASAVLWPAHAFAVVAYLQSPYGRWPLVALAMIAWESVAVPLVGIVFPGAQLSVAVNVAFSLANVATAAGAAAALRAYKAFGVPDCSPVVRIPRGVVALGMGVLPGAVLGSIAYQGLAGVVPQLSKVGFWWLASVLSILTYGPLLSAKRGPPEHLQSAPARAWEKAAVTALITVLLVGFAHAPISATELPFALELLTVPLMWLALRFSGGHTQLGVAIISTGVAASVAHNPAAIDAFAGAGGWRMAVLPIDTFLMVGCAGALLINLLTVRERALLLELEVEHYQLRRYANALDVADETARRAVASDLHDGIAQVLAGQAMTIAALRTRCKDMCEVELIDQIADAARDAQRSVRHMVQDLSPPEMEGASIREALEWLANLFQTRHAFEVRWHVAPGVSLTPDCVRMLYRCVRELLYNAYKHAQRTCADVTVIVQDGTAIVTVMDQGVGFDVDQITTEPGQHFGLVQLRERLHAERATLSLESSPGEGCCATIRLPLVATS